MRSGRAACAGPAPCRKSAQFALTLGETYGIWGGLTEAERRRLARQAAPPTTASTSGRSAG
ncbi:WhiB family transcriptional regulator [Streptomyces sp. NPDC001315]|uniref:WhiB family transcriptional regulator n=1 Tax=Streptomyces sp. NPDC001315 TaxID=3364562 RepID=UPI00369CF215